jgi:energy-coupling factor transporter ATP-binding protein EcfA2
MPAAEPSGRAGDETAPALRAHGLGYRFADGAWAYRGIDFTLSAGKIAVLAGRNGAGKTFLAKCLAGLLDPTEGSVFVSGSDIRLISGSRAQRIGYVFQDARLQAVGETVLDDALFGPTNLGLPPAEARSRAEDSLLACGLSGMKDRFVHNLSGGELRRLAIAGVLAMLPDAVVLDEPFVNLDPEGVRAVLRIARDMAGKGIAVLIVTHELEKVLGLACSLSVMDGGRIVMSGEPASILAAGIESCGLRNPFRQISRIEDLQWLD